MTHYILKLQYNIHAEIFQHGPELSEKDGVKSSETGFNDELWNAMTKRFDHFMQMNNLRFTFT